MTLLWICLGVAALLLLLSLLTAYICFYKVFYTSRKEHPTEEFPIPEGEIYEPFREQMVAWMKENRQRVSKDLYVTSFDGLRLHGRFYEYAPNAPIEILFHGYRGSAERDLSGGVARCFALGRSALVVDQRAAGESEGHVITFGVLESRDCLAWANYVATELAPDVKIILTGISMGAATVMMVAAEELPPQVVGILADCGYTSAREIIQKVMRDRKLPAPLLYPFVKLGARLFGGFDPDLRSPVSSLQNSRLPVIFFHGDTDDFVPHAMSLENYRVCSSEKRMVTVHGAGHGLCFPVDKEGYLQALREFFDPILNQ
ncbi:MAG: alpha/beta hydrolase [Ruminococcaceae bacterium]|nr:alpha/beta hydrolase [Oscillospiraceae bacterium]